jgi:hypothetical protein
MQKACHLLVRKKLRCSNKAPTNAKDTAARIDNVEKETFIVSCQTFVAIPTPRSALIQRKRD